MYPYLFVCTRRSAGGLGRDVVLMSCTVSMDTGAVGRQGYGRA